MIFAPIVQIANECHSFFAQGTSCQATTHAQYANQYLNLLIAQSTIA